MDCMTTHNPWEHPAARRSFNARHLMLPSVKGLQRQEESTPVSLICCTTCNVTTAVADNVVIRWSLADGCMFTSGAPVCKVTEQRGGGELRLASRTPVSLTHVPRKCKMEIC